MSFEEFAALFKKPAMPVTEGEGNCVGMAARDASGHITPYRFTRRACGPHDVNIQITHAGICHSDLHQAKNEWGGSSYPMVPGECTSGCARASDAARYAPRLLSAAASHHLQSPLPFSPLSQATRSWAS